VRVRIHWMVAIVVALGAAGLQTPAADCPAFLLKRGPEALTVERVIVPDGETRVWEAGPESGLIDVILPVGPGGSGSDARAGSVHIVRCADGAIERRVRHAKGETAFPSRSLDELRRYDIRVSATGPDGTGAAFRIAGYETAERDRGPVQNPFAGVPLPLGDHDYIVFTDTQAREVGQPASGWTPVELAGHPFALGRGPDGKEGWFLVDIGAAQTPIEESGMIQYSSAGRRVLDYAPGGATGTVKGVLGHAPLPSLQFGEIRFTDVNAAVMEEIPDLFDRPVVGILGMDLMRRAARLTLEFPDGGKGAGRLGLEAESETPGKASELPFSIVRSHLVVTARVNGTPVHFILDSGAPAPFLDPEAARQAGVEVSSSESGKAGGLDGGKVDLGEGTIRRLELGDEVITDLVAKVAPLSVFNSLQSDGQGIGLLGNSFFGRFERVEIDFRRSRVRFVR